ncbi:MAG: dTDP-4-dehydrorhamnose 3,5-epimerase [Bacteroidia bacterium]
MTISETGINGLLHLIPKVFEDSRGYFLEAYNKQVFNDLGIKETFVQDNLSKSEKNVLRGLHFQNPPHAQGKLVSVICGAVLDVAVDIRKNSPTYGRYYAAELSEKNKHILWIPPGFAHGFLTLEDNTVFSYKCTGLYNKSAEDSILWNDSDLNINWGITNPKLSEKDQNAQTFKGFHSKF